MKLLRSGENLVILALVANTGATGYLLLYGLPQRSGSDSGKPLAVLEQRNNLVRRKPSNVLAWEDFGARENAFANDQVFTGSSSSASLKFDNGTVLTLGANSLIKLELQKAETVIKVDKGFVSGDLKSSKSAALSIEVGKNKIVPGNQGTKLQIKIDSTKGQKSEILLKEGQAVLKTGNQSAEIKKDELARVADNGEGVEVSTPKISLVETKSEVYISDDKSAFRVNWEVNEEEAKYFEVLVAGDPGFNNIIKRVRTNKPTTAIAGLDEGTYYWKVIGHFKNGMESSPEQSITLIREQAPELLWPSSNEMITNDGKKSIALMWGETENATSYQVQIARDRSFKELILSEKSQQTAVVLPDSLRKPGTYFWRVKALVGDRTEAPWSETGEFAIGKKNNNTKLAQPARDQKITDPDAPVVFKWSSECGKCRYHITISKDKNFSNPLADSDTQEKTYSWKSATTGKFYWRVQTISDDTTEVTEDGTFTIEEPPKLAPPKLEKEYKFEVKPGDEPSSGERKIEKKWWGFFSIFETAYAQSGASISINWPPVEGATGYVVEIASDNAFENVVFKVTNSSPQFQWQPKRPGTFFFRVAAIDQRGKRGGFSQPSKLQVAFPPPTLVAPHFKKELRITAPSTNINFLWKAPARGERYLLEVARDRSFKTPFLKKETTENSYTATGILPGIGYWRVGVRYESNGEYQFSNVGQFTVEKLPEPTPTPTVTPQPTPTPPPLVAPLDLAPKDKESFPAKGSQTAVALSWSPVVGAADYEIQVSPEAAFAKPVVSRSLKETSVEIKVVSGNYFWRVRAKSADQKTGPWATQSFGVKAQPVLPPPPPPTPPPQKPKRAQPWLWQAKGSVKPFRWYLAPTLGAVLENGEQNLNTGTVQSKILTSKALAFPTLRIALLGDFFLVDTPLQEAPWRFGMETVFEIANFFKIEEQNFGTPWNFSSLGWWQFYQNDSIALGFGTGYKHARYAQLGVDLAQVSNVATTPYAVLSTTMHELVAATYIAMPPYTELGFQYGYGLKGTSTTGDLSWSHKTGSEYIVTLWLLKYAPYIAPYVQYQYVTSTLDGVTGTITMDTFGAGAGYLFGK